MKKYLKILPFIFLISILTIQDSSSQLVEEDSKFYIGFGSALSSFIGGDFGKTFAIRYSTGSYENDNGYYYNKPSSYNNESTTSSLYPLQVDLVAGVNVTKSISFELETSFIWHSNGKINPEYSFGSEGDYNYIDRFDNSTLFALPIIASIKVYPVGRENSPFYLKGGYGIQYTQENLEKVREFYTVINSGYYFYTDTYEFPIAEYSSNRLLHGFNAAIGYSYNLFGTLAGDIELRYSNFFNNKVDKAGPLSLFTSPVIGNIALGTKVYLSY